MDRRQSCVNLSVQPSRGLVDEKFIILVQNVFPGFQLTLHALHNCEDGYSWEAFAHYTASATGTVNVSEDPSLGGTYSGVEPMGLLWSLRPVSGSKPGLRMRKMNVQTPMEVRISVYQGHQTEGFMDQVPLAGVMVERWYMAPGVCRIPITEDRLDATLFLPPGPGPFPAVLDLWGGGGKLVEYRAALLASRGIAAMALDYMTPKVVRETGKMVDNTYFEKAYRVLEQHPQILGSRIAMLGISFGTSVILKMAVYSKVIKPNCAVCISGSHVQPIEGSIEDILRYYDKGSGKTQVTEENHIIWRNILLPIPTDPSFKVDVGKLQCPLMLVVGEDDQNWPAQESAMDMKEMMEQAGNSHLLTVLSYPNAGHLIEPPFTPFARFSNFRSTSFSQMVMALWGGELVAHSRAQEDAWRKTLVFLKENLFSSSDSQMRKINVHTPMEVRISVYQGHQTEGFMDQVPLAGVMVERWYMAPGVRRIPITEDRLDATLFLPPGPGPFPGLLDLWGSAKLSEYRASLLASHGIAAMALNYLTPKEVLETGNMVDNTYFEKAYRVLEQHPQILGSRIAMLGISFGTSVILKMAVYSKVIKLRCAVCISGSHVQLVEGSVEEMLGYFHKHSNKTSFTDKNLAVYRNILLPIPTDPSLKVDVGKLQCSLLLVVGEDDQNWPAKESAKDMKEMMKRAGNSHLLTVLSYPNTGHVIEPAYMPFARFSNFRSLQSTGTVMALWGGELVAHCRAQEDAWRKTLVFLKENLFGSSDSH